MKLTTVNIKDIVDQNVEQFYQIADTFNAAVEVFSEKTLPQTALYSIMSVRRNFKYK